MLRTTAARAVPQSLTALRTPSARTSLTKLTQRAAFRTSTRPVKTSPTLALAVQQPLKKSLVRYATTEAPKSQIIWGQDPEAEKALQSEKIVPAPEQVSTESSIHNVMGETATENKQEDDVDMMAGVRSDFVRD